MKQLTGTGAVSLLLHGGLALLLLAVGRGNGVVPPRALYVVLPAVDAGGGPLNNPEAREGREHGGRGAEARASRTRTAPASRSAPTPSPVHGGHGANIRALAEPARHPSPLLKSSPTPRALPGAGARPAVTRSDTTDAPRQPDLDRPTPEPERSDTALLSVSHETRAAP